MIGRRYISKAVLKNEVDANSYLACLPAVRQLASSGGLDLNADVVFFVGENGTGKSTLVEAIAVAFGFNPEGGSRNFNFKTKNSHSDLWKSITLAKGSAPRDGYFLRAESFYNVASNIDDMDAAPSFDPPVITGYGGISLHSRSHGESFMALVQNRLGGKGLYIMDEPEAALSPMKQMSLLYEIDRLVKNSSQLIIATHSPILMAYPGAKIYEFSADGIMEKNYRETEHYNVTKQFLSDPERMIRYLFEDSEK